MRSASARVDLGKGKRKKENFCETNGMERRGLRTVSVCIVFVNFLKLGKLGPS